MCGNTFRKAFFERKKLCLVLDLDHTLLHSVRVQDVSVEDQEYLNLRVSSMKDSDGNSLYMHMGCSRYTKLRPYTREFLREASKYFELFIYTMGTRDYAEEMGRLLDPQGKIFKSRIVSKDDSTKENRKNLDILSGPNELNTIIVDDTKRVWKKNKRNLIRIEKYNYFTEGGHILKKDDEQGSDHEDVALESITEILQGVHKIFFQCFPVPSPDELNEYIKSVDVRPLLQGFLKKKKGKVQQPVKSILDFLVGYSPF
ncbi:RNA polymerase II C-terminal domain phosphatase-like 4 [Papaver somniferum]|uniref:RNA polymerase II C-terminal domain phosphatase-like 4 n=1 Tax=Papaver somniferum TaxID=3469 RepID=UPI000E70391B|nr:RNA polymerase II C-terminal domain phosphatase-like 4 [Papaver somniferum]